MLVEWEGGSDVAAHLCTTGRVVLGLPAVSCPCSSKMETGAACQHNSWQWGGALHSLPQGGSLAGTTIAADLCSACDPLQHLLTCAKPGTAHLAPASLISFVQNL